MPIGATHELYMWARAFCVSPFDVSTGRSLAIAVCILFVVLVVCSTQFSLRSIVSPRYFAESVQGMFCPLIFIFALCRYVKSLVSLFE